VAETFSTRFGLRLYGAGTDTWSRVEYNDDLVQKLDDQAAIDGQGTLAARPAPAIRGFYYYATDTGALYRDTGAAWVSVGSRATDAVFSGSGAATVPLTASAVLGQTANVFEAKVNNANVAVIEADGDVNTVAGFIGKYTTLTGTVVGQVVADLKGAAAQTAEVLRARNDSNVNLFSVLASGALTGRYLQAGDGSGAVGTNTLTTPPSMTLFTGPPAFEIYGNKGGANTAFTEYLYLHHQAADATVVSRRIGVLMQIGDVSGDAAKSGAIYVESTSASAANPDLVLARGDAVVARFRQNGTSEFTTQPTIAGTTTITPGTAASLVSGNTAIGTHAGNDMYLRTNTNNGFYLYAGGVHSATPGDAGLGGTRLASLIKSGSVGLLATDRLELAAGSRVPSSTTQSLRIGASGGNRVNFSEDGIQAASGASSAATLNVNTSGGTVVIGSASSATQVAGTFFIAGRKFTISDTAPSSPTTGDVWIDT
jgi:hypothetical protein